MKIFLKNGEIIEGRSYDYGDSVLKVRATYQAADGSDDYIDHEIPRERIVRIEKTQQDYDDTSSSWELAGAVIVVILAVYGLVQLLMWGFS